MELDEVLNRTVKSIVALTSRSVLLQLIGVISQIILGGLLLHTEFGVYFVISSVMRIFTFFTDLGLGAALIQKKEEIEHQDLVSSFTIQTLLVGSVVIVGFLFTPIVQSYAHLDRAGVFLYQVLIFTLFISSLKMIPSILLERKLAFEKQIIPQIIETLVFNVLVIILAWRHLGVASFSWAILISSLLGLPIYYLLSPWKISLGISTFHAKHLIRYGLPFQGKSILAIIKDDLLTFFLSGIVGTSGIGYWGFAQKFAYYPFRLVVDSVTKVTFPAYSRVQHDNNILRLSIEKSLMAVSIVVFPILTLMSVLAGNLISLVPRYYQWLPALPSFYFLCAGAAISALSNILVNALDATGRVKTTLMLMIFWVILSWLSTLAFVFKFGFTGIAIASFAVSLTIVVTIYLVNQVVKFSFVNNVYKPLIASLLAGTTSFLISRSLPNSFLTVFLSAVAGVIIYLCVMYVLARKELLADLRIVVRTFKR